MLTFIAITTLVVTTLINAFGVRLLATLNNIGVATEILGMLVFALVLLFFANNQSPDVLISRRSGRRQPNNGNLARHLRARHVHVDLHRVRLRHGRQLRRGDDRREPPGAARRALLGAGSRASSASSSCWP